MTIVRSFTLRLRALMTAFLALVVATTLALTLSASGAAAATTPHLASARSVAMKVLHLLNYERAAHHLPPLTMNGKLINSAHAHNVRMARLNRMSHQLTHEASLGDRISAAHFQWTWAGENIGWNSDMSINGARYLEQIMYDERPPGETGHRDNILSRNYTAVGIDIYYDLKHGKLWLTEDFGRGA